MNSDYLLTVHPTTEANWLNENVRTEGMVLRDYFAAKAMASLCMVNQGNMPEPACQQAYVWAGAMLAARNK